MQSFIKKQITDVQNGGFRVLLKKTGYFLLLIIHLLKLKIFIRKIFVEICSFLASLKINSAYIYCISCENLYRKRDKLIQKYHENEGQIKDISYKVNKIENRIETYLVKATKIDEKYLKTYKILAKLYYDLGRFNDMLSVNVKKEKIREKLIRVAQYDKLKLTIIPSNIPVGAIGVYENLEGMIKAELLKLREINTKIIPVYNPKAINNKYYFDCWSKFTEQVTNIKTIYYLSKIGYLLHESQGEYICLNNIPVPIYYALGKIREDWLKKNKKPLLRLSSDEKLKGWKVLNELGVPSNSWFVTLHVREPGWRDGKDKGENWRNCNIETYYKAINTITDAGGWVIRIGDPISMTRLPEMNNVIDYAHNKIKSDWMDVFLSSECKFMIATSSGMYTMCEAFGVPVVMTNILYPANIYALTSNDMFIPRLCRNKKTGKYLSFRKYLSSPVCIAASMFTYDKLGLEIIENSPEEINEVVEEMLLIDSKNGNYTSLDKSLQSDFQRISCIASKNNGLEKNYSINARVSKKFLKKYSNLIN